VAQEALRQIFCGSMAFSSDAFVRLGRRARKMLEVAENYIDSVSGRQEIDLPNELLWSNKYIDNSLT